MRVIIGYLLSFICLATLTSAINASPQFVERYSLHGTACMPANLGQAINLGAAWSKFGVRNLNPEGSGKSFFVACPVIFGDDTKTESVLSSDDVWVGYWTGNITTPVTVTCTAFWYNFDGTLLNSVTAQGFSDSPNSQSDFNIANLVDPNIQQISGLNQQISIVCSLPPQSGITAIKFDYD